MDRGPKDTALSKQARMLQPIDIGASSGSNFFHNLQLRNKNEQEIPKSSSNNENEYQISTKPNSLQNSPICSAVSKSEKLPMIAQRRSISRSVKRTYNNEIITIPSDEYSSKNEEDDQLYGKHCKEDVMIPIGNNIFCKKTVLEEAISTTKLATCFSLKLLKGVFKKSTIISSTLTQLNLKARMTIVEYCLNTANKRGWIRQYNSFGIQQAMTQYLYQNRQFIKAKNFANDICEPKMPSNSADLLKSDTVIFWYTEGCQLGKHDIQSWWEIPCISHFCSLFSSAFDLPDIDIEDLESALLSDGTTTADEELHIALVPELIVRLLKGCDALSKVAKDITHSNYQMFLRRFLRRQCRLHNCENHFDTDIDFQSLPVRKRLLILYDLCHFRLESNKVQTILNNLESDSLRVEPLGYDSNNSGYWYFYGTRLYREDKPDASNSLTSNSVWQVICFTEEDWQNLAKKFKASTNAKEKELYQILDENFLPKLPQLFRERERLRRRNKQR